MINLGVRKSTFSETVRDQSYPLVIVFFPIQVDIESYLFVVKLITVKSNKSSQEEENSVGQTK